MKKEGLLTSDEDSWEHQEKRTKERLRMIEEYMNSRFNAGGPKKVFYHYNEWSGWRFYLKAIRYGDWKGIKSHIKSLLTTLP